MQITRLIFILPALLAFYTVGHAQFQEKSVEETFALPSGKKARLELKFARQIIVHTWERDELKLKKNFTFSDPELMDIHIMETIDQNDELRIQTGFAEREHRQEGYSCWSCDEQNPNRDCICFSVSYEIWLPEDATLDLETISGDIEMRGFRGPARVKSISGYLDVGLPGRAPAQLSFKSVTGEIYTDFDDITLDERSTSYSKRLNSPLNGGGPMLQLETVSGDIFFRKI